MFNVYNLTNDLVLLLWTHGSAQVSVEIQFYPSKIQILMINSGGSLLGIFEGKRKLTYSELLIGQLPSIWQSYWLRIN